MARARAHTRCLPPLRVPIKHFTDSTALPSPPAWLFGPHHSPQSKPVFIKLLWNVGKADTEEVVVYLGGAKYFIALSVAHCDWVVYAVNAGDKPMGHWLLVVPAWWSLAKKKKKDSVGPFSASAHRENTRYARLPVQPCCQATGNSPGSPDGQSAPAKEYEWPTLEKIHTHKSRPIHTRKMICTFTVHDTLVNFKH